MPTTSEAIDAAIQEVQTARSFVSKIKAKQVTGVDALASLKAMALTWFNTHRTVITAGAPSVDLEPADRQYTIILNSTAKFAARQTYLTTLSEAKAALIVIRATVLKVSTVAALNADDLAPDFSPLAGNQEIREILTRRWH